MAISPASLSEIHIQHRLNALPQPPLSWSSCLTPAFAGTNPPLHPSGHLTPAEPQHPAGNAGSFKRKTKISLLHGIPWSSSPFSSLHWEGTSGNISFLPKEQWAHSMPGWKKSHQALVSTQLPSQLCRHWLTPAFGLLWVTFLKFKQRAAKCKAVEGTTIHLWGCTQTFTLYLICAWTEPRLSALKSSLPGNWHLRFFTAAKGIVYYICSALGYNKKEKIRQKILQTRLSLGILTTKGKFFVLSALPLQWVQFYSTLLTATFPT